jgi:hypothetical protein
MDSEEEIKLMAEKAKELRDLMAQVDGIDFCDRYEFVRIMLAVGSCITNKKNHGVFLLVENEETLKVMSVNATFDEAGHITTNAADMFVSTHVSKELNRRGETH